MISAALLFLTLLYYTSAASYNSVEGTGMKSLFRGVGTTPLSIPIQSADFYDAVVFGYFKFSAFDTSKRYSIMRFQVDQGYTFLHYYTIGSSPYMTAFTDQDNQYQDIQPGPGLYAGVWFELGFGYKHSIRSYYPFWQGIPQGPLVIPQIILPLHALRSDITQMQLCILCAPQEYKYTQFPGSYSSIKLINGFDPTQGLKLIINEAAMTDAILRNAFQYSADILAYTKAQYLTYTTDLDVHCITTTTMYFDGVCILPVNCPNIVYYWSNEFGNMNSVFYNNAKAFCDTCPDNCSLCDNSANCQQCNFGYYLDTNANLCKKCAGNTFYNPLNSLCVAACPNGYFQDIINSLCTQTFNPFYHLFNPILIPRNFKQNEGFNLIDSSSTVLTDIYTQCYLENQSFGPYTILGGSTNLNTNTLNKKINGLPKNFQKIISFQVLLYNNGIQGDINLIVNSNPVTLTSYKKIFSNYQLCTDNLPVNYYEVQYIINDSTTDLDIRISTNKLGWGIRNFSMNITKCHSTCLDCTTDGNPWSCTTCKQQSTSLYINKSCACARGQYAQFQNCYTSPCYACTTCPPNCSSCEDQTGKCTSCASGFSVQNGLCITNTSCTNYYNLDPGSSYCIKGKDFGQNMYILDRIVANLDFWQYTGLPNRFYPCSNNRVYAPYLYGTESITLVMPLLNYFAYHFQVEINFTATNIDNMSINDYISYYIDTVFIKKQNYRSSSTQSLCNDINYGETLVPERLTLLKSSSNPLLTFKMVAYLPSSLYFTFNDMTINYTRCHASCQTCPNGTSCTLCIANASQDATKGNFCYCNQGYYFTYDWNTSSGLCLPCNNFCNTCSGPNITDCTSCKESYAVSNGTCINACTTNQFWDFTLHQCVNCSECCATCSGNQSTQCLTCPAGIMTFNSPVCQFTSDSSTCNSCTGNVANSFCGGTQTNHNYCLTQGYINFNASTCIYCPTADASGNCGGASQYNTPCNQQGFFYSATSGTCLSCASAVGTNCGDTTIRAQCQANKWIYQSLSTCISCLLTKSPLCCDPSCNTCNGQSATNCLSCYSPQILFNSSCQDKCPNGYKLDPSSYTCQSCPIFIGVPECNNCSADCNTCTAAQSNQCKTCYSSRQLNASTNRCDCKDTEDTRTTYYECSLNNQAVLTITLSNTGPTMVVNFGKILQDLPGFGVQELSNNVCKAIFDSSNMNKIGSTATCQVIGKLININLDTTATIMQGDTLNFLPNVLKFAVNSISYINVFLNNIAYQTAPSNTGVVFTYNKIENSCNNYKITLDKITNDSSRGFSTISWSLLNPTSNSDDIQIQTILSQASSSNQASIIIPKGIIRLNSSKTIQVSYLLKNTYTSSQQFVFSVQTFKNIVSTLTSNIQTPFYRFFDFTLSITYLIQYCDASGNQISSSDLIDVTISSPQTSLINTNIKGTASTTFSQHVDTYTFTSGISQINVLLALSSDSTVTSTQQLNINTIGSALIVKIDGGNRKVDYKSLMTLSANARDLDVQDQTASQGITLTWTCTDPSDPTKGCVDQNTNPFSINSNNPVIPPGTFNPYTVIKVGLAGSKDTRTASDQIIVLFIEFDLPPLDVGLRLIDPFALSVNLNEEIFASLNYDKTVNPDILSFSSSIVYGNDVVSALKFDYTTVRFSLWDHYSSFNSAIPTVTIRFSVFNPYYFMPSISILNFKINFPPTSCIFGVSPLPSVSSPAFSLQTIFTLSMSGCQDANTPLSYQFFLYQQSTDYQSEITDPQKILRRQLNDLSSSSSITTMLPSGNLIIMAVAQDSLKAVYNTTLSVTVTNLNMDATAYSSTIDKALTATTQTSADVVASLSLIAQDLSQRADLSPNAGINSRKILIINALKVATLTLSPLSTFSSLSNKAQSSLMQSGIQFSQNQETTQLTDIQTALNEDWSVISYQNLTDTQKSLRNQQMYDYFSMIDHLVANSQSNSSDVQSLQVDITGKIGQKMNYNTLPNEDPKIFSGNKIVLQSQQITEKNLCGYLFCSDYLPSSQQQGQPIIYNIAYSTYTDNPYKADPSYQNFTTYLTQNIGNSSVVTFPVKNPEITSSSPPSANSPINKDNIQLTFKGTAEKREGLACFTKSKGQWTQSGCKLVYNSKINEYSCFCESIGPTTIVNDLDALINNKNLQTAFGKQGLENISQFSNFYEYVAFWLLVLNTIGFVALYQKGKSLDRSFHKVLGISGETTSTGANKGKVYPLDLNTFVKDSNQNMMTKEKRLATSQQQLDSSIQLAKGKNDGQLSDRMKPPQQKIVPQKSIFSIQDQESVQNDKQKNSNSDENLNSLEGESKKGGQQVDDDAQSMKTIQIQEALNKNRKSDEEKKQLNIPSIEALNNIKSTSKEQKNQSEIVIDTQMQMPTLTSRNDGLFRKTASKKSMINFTDQQISEKTQKFIDMNPLKQIIYFHNFFGIFYVFDEEMPRTLRFSCFYVRLVHSFAISVIFDQAYSPIQLIALSIANCILIMICLTLLEIAHKRLGKYAIVVCLLTLLGFYYYIILSIISGQLPSRSNQAVGSIVLFTCLDIFGISFISAILQRSFAIKTMRKEKIQTCQQKILQFLHIQLILTSII